MFEGELDLKEDCYIERNAVEKYKENPVNLIEEKRVNTIKELKELFPNCEIVACDFYISEIEKIGEEKENCLRKENILCIDHHAPIDKFSKKISSANIAIDYVKKFGVVDESIKIVTNHTDCDSVLTCLILKGILPPRKELGDAAIAADHTGEENKIADLMQALQYERNIEMMLRNLKLLLENKDFEPAAKKLLDKRIDDRKSAEKIIENGNIKKCGSVYYIELKEKIDPNFFLSKIPEAKIFLTFSPHKKNVGNLEVRSRVGIFGLGDGIKLNEIGMNEFDENWGGRWNAGSNKRGGGIKIEPEEYANNINKKLENNVKFD